MPQEEGRVGSGHVCSPRESELSGRWEFSRCLEAPKRLAGVEGVGGGWQGSPFGFPELWPPGEHRGVNVGA